MLDPGACLQLQSVGVDRVDMCLIYVDKYDVGARAVEGRAIEAAHRAGTQDQDFHCAASSIIPPPSSSNSFTSIACPRARCSATKFATFSRGTRWTTMSS